MENAVKLLLVGFYVSLFAASISVIIFMHIQLDKLYEYVDNHITVKSVLEDSLIE